jgi:hypothetical protein
VLDVDDGVLGLDDVLGLIAELDDVVPELLGVDGVADDDELDGDGATTGGVVDFDGAGVSRWQPATPSAMPAQRRVTKAGFVMRSPKG